MSKQRQFESLVIKDLEESKFHLPVHDHTFYELVYIYKGYGLHHINQRSHVYQQGDLLFIAPGDQHEYHIQDRTRFVLFKFTDHYFADWSTTGQGAAKLLHPTAIMRRQYLKEVRFQIQEPQQKVLKNLVDNLLAYHQSGIDVFTSEAVYHHLLAIFGLVHDRLQQQGELPHGGEAYKESIAAYIHEHIYQPDSYRIKAIAGYFHISPLYFSAYFKRNFGVSYRSYINGYRTSLIESRLKSGQMSLKEIASEFGFTDESHLSNYFKSQKASTPVQFRKQDRAGTSS